jgi:hypothetical protein
MSPSRVLSRYAPLVAVLAVQAMLVLGAPTGTTTVTNANGAAPGVTGGNGGTTGAGAVGGPPGAASGPGGTTTGGTTAGGAVAGSNGTGSTVAATGPKDLSHCDKNGKQLGVIYMMPPCQPVWHGGNNGGATMRGVSASTIKYVYFQPQGNAEVNAILARENLAASSEQRCEAIQAFHNELNKRFEFYGRKLVSMDGAGGYAGSKQQNNCHFPYFQSQCTLTPPDYKCYRAEADTIAKMGPVVVLDQTGLTPLDYRLAQDHITVITIAAAPEQYFEQLAPYLYSAYNGTQQAQLFAEYWCKKLVGKRVQYAGMAPGDAGDFDSNPATPPDYRKLGISYIKNPGDPTFEISAKYLAGLVSGGMCGHKGDAIISSYASDITRAQDQTNTYIATMKHNHITDTTCYCDPIAPVFASNGEDQQNYHPEQVGIGYGLLDYDVLAQLYNQNVWRNTLGLSDLGNPIPFSDSDAVKAWHDTGNSGEPDGTENLALAFYTYMGIMLQQAGPTLNTTTMHNGLLALKPIGGDPIHPAFGFTKQFPYSSMMDIREVYWCPTRKSPINGQSGSYVPLLGGKRISLGQFTNSLDGAFPNGQCPVAGTQQQ